MHCARPLLAWAAAAVAAALAAAAPSSPDGVDAGTDEPAPAALQLYRSARGYDDHHYAPATPAPPPEPERGKAESEALSNYYEFLVNEGSFKFWAVFEVATALLLIYSAFAAIYYAKYTYATTEYDYDYFWKRSGDLAPPAYDDGDADGAGTGASSGGGGGSSFLGMTSATFQRIMDAISSKKYS